ncbi:MAG: hypothetical protein ABI877_21780 [Gemmatimonadaceae bacterium]
MSSSAAAATLDSRPIIYLGMDVHKDSIVIAVLPQYEKVKKRPVVTRRRQHGWIGWPMICRS